MLHMKKILLVMMSVFLLLGSSSVLAEPVKTEAPFVDIKGHWAQEAIEILYDAGFVSGVDATHFAPNKKLSRAEFAALLVRMFELESDEAVSYHFKDVKEGKWYSEAVMIAEAYGLMGGYADHTFRPLQNVTREEMAVIFSRLLVLIDASLSLSEQEQAQALASFKDKASITWSKEGVSQIVSAGIMGGKPNSLFAPKDASTRAESAAVLIRFTLYLADYLEE